MSSRDLPARRARRRRPDALSNTGRLLRERVRKRLIDAVGRPSDAGAAFHLDYRQAVEQLEHSDMLRRLRTAHGVGILLWPPFALLDLLIVDGDPGLLRWLFGLRVIGCAMVLAVFLALRRSAVSPVVVMLARVGTFVGACIVLALMCVRFEGLESRYTTGIIMVIMIRSAFVAEPWRAALLPYALMWLALPATMIAAAPFEPRLSAQWHDTHALTVFGMENFFCLSIALTGVACSNALWRLRREAYEARHLGRYRLKQRIGRGGMGEVWVAYHVGLRQDVALKVLSSHAGNEHEAVARFEREVLTIARLSHPNTVRILDHGVTPEGIWFYAMELLQGSDLAALLRREGPLPPTRATHLMTQVCAALAEAHRQGVVHRDLKPGNIFVATVAGQEDFVKLLDFGLAKLTLEPDDALTRDGSVLGTPQYMAPETLAEGALVDARSDVYALGCVLYEMLTGSPPFADSNWRKLLRQVAEQQPEPPSRRSRAPLPPELEVVVMRCLEKSPEWRFDSAAELGAALSTLRI